MPFWKTEAKTVWAFLRYETTFFNDNIGENIGQQCTNAY